MAVLNPLDFKSKWDARFANNDQFDIDEADLRDFAQDIKDSFTNKDASFWDNFTTSSAAGNLPVDVNLTGLTDREVLKKILTRSFRIATASINSFALLEKGANNPVTIAGSFTVNDSVLSSRQLKKNGALWATVPGNSFSYSDSIYETTTYLLNAQATKADGGTQSITATREAKCVAPSFYGVSADEFVLVDEAKLGSKQIWDDAASRSISFSSNNAHPFFTEPKAFGRRLRIVDQNGFNVTAGFEVLERLFTLKANTAPSGSPSNAITEINYIYIKKVAAGNGSAFTYTFHKS